MQNLKGKRSVVSSRVLLAAILLCLTLLCLTSPSLCARETQKSQSTPTPNISTSPAQVQYDPHEYAPSFQKIAYRRRVPAAIRRMTKQKWPTRFFGVWRQGSKTLALHFFDKGRVFSTHLNADDETLERKSGVDIFQRAANGNWKRIGIYSLTRVVDSRRDRLRVEAQFLWLDPARKTVPLLYLKVSGDENRPSFPTGSQTDIYGVFEGAPKFTAFFGNIPFGNITVRLSEISYPDAKGHLTILCVVSDPGAETLTAYGWTGKEWKLLREVHQENRYETALWWNGTRFMPFQPKTKRP